MKNGFTLAEILIVIAIMSVVGVLVLGIFTQTLRGTNKSQIIAVMKENGQSILETINNNVRNADNVVCPTIIAPATTASSNTLVTLKNGVYTRYRFESALATTSNGQIKSDNPFPKTDEADDLNEFLRRVCDSADSMPQLNTSLFVLTDTNQKTGVSLLQAKDSSSNPIPYIMRSVKAGSKDVITVQFALEEGVLAPPAVAGQIDPVTFQTAIELR